MNKYKLRYESYKDSGVEWLGQIPSHWGIKKLNSILTVKSEKNSPDLPLLSVYREYGVILKDSRDDNHNAAALDLSGYKIVKNGDFVINKMKAWQGSMGVSQYHGIVSPAYITCNIDYNIMYARYLHALLRCSSYIGEYNRLSYGIRIGQWDMHFEDFKNITLCIIPIEEQQRIADFLDKKTAQIDEAIAQKEKMIELLKEYRQVTINNAVTKGLDPNVPMKDSGIEWLGQIPTRWEVKKLKFILTEKLKYGANESGIDYSEKLPRYIRITDFGNNGKLSDVNKLSLPTHIANDYLLKDGDILFARSGGTVGKSYQFRNNISYDESYCFAGYLIKASANEQIILSDFLYLYTNSPLFYLWKDFIFNKATIENIGADKYAQLPVIIPPINEQKQIVEYLDNITNKIEAAITCKQSEIEKLKEYKATLIDSAVTGKIKV